jgi:Cu(I)/Ag(I) efflux system membrane fusion protein
MIDQLQRAGQRLRPHLGKAGILLVGFLLGGLVFSIRSCGEHEPHAEQPAEAGKDSVETVWTCSMHPQIRSPEKGLCPLCGMDLIPVDSGDGSDSDDPSRIVFSDRARALAGLVTAPVRRHPDASAGIRLLGRIEPDETTLKTVTAWTGGRIDRLHATVTGQQVRAGQVVATLYSPEVFAAHQDLIVAGRQVERMAAGAESSRQAAVVALEAVRDRLRLLGVPRRELQAMEGQDRPTTALPVRTPFAGTVIERLVNEGAYVTTGAVLYRLADLNRLWVQLDAYENDLARLSIGQQVHVTVEALPGQDFAGVVTFIEPSLDARRRTARVRVELDNPGGHLRPGMFAQATVETGLEGGSEPALMVPSTAPLFTGRRSVVYVKIDQDDRIAYEARTVRLGSRMGDFYPVVAGLSEGDQVVVRGAFAIDADLQIRGGAGMMTMPDDREEGAWDDVIELPSSERARLAPVVLRYLDVQRALAADDDDAARAAASRLSAAVAEVAFSGPPEAIAAWPDMATGIQGHARHVEKAGDIEGARTGFEALSREIEALLHRFGNPTDRPLHLAFCPMVKGNKGAFWIQQGSTIDNSYFGASMLTCGEIRQEIAPGAYLIPRHAKAATEDKASQAPAGGHRH